MLPEYWPSSTNLPDTSSDGLLLTNLKKLLAQWRLANEADPSRASLILLGATVNSAGQEVSLLWTEEGENATKRWIGCAMMCRMPDEGVDEALVSLRDIWEFHETTHRMLPRPVETRRYVGRIVGTSQRPDLVISE